MYGKIGVLIDQIAKGGTSKLAIEEVRQMQIMGTTAELLVLYDNSQGLYSDMLAGIKVRVLWNELPRCLRINAKIPLFSFFSLFHILYIIFLPLMIKRNRYSCIISHLGYTCFSAYSLSKVKKIPYVAYVHDSISYIIKKVYLNKKALRFFFYPVFVLSKFTDRLILKNAIAVCKQSRFEADYLEKISGKKVYIIPPATYKRRDAIPSQRGNRLSAFTKWDFSKNFEFLIRIIKKLPVEHKLYVAGQWHPAEYLTEVKKSISKEGLGERIVFLTDLDEGGIQKFFDEAFFLIHPLIEAWGSTLYEAACNGVTFIAPQGCGISDFLIHERDGFYPPQDNLEQYLHYIRLLINTPDRAYEMGKQAWLDIKTIDIKNHVGRLLKAIEENKK
ncbi:MAG: glycosyltransferase family 4 protein [Candidatus Omnitrophica bacterium]|nr:glycosyltransferase family 4 protein [Candidatus Omnitrophota bacterium]